ncbi:DUF771 domain-containing protein [Macrococcus bovicus]|uniref:DUF771 domain-containing protein n=1 Tax=Macrococcus bovicus TaxID=69968 RepID=A0A4R6C2Y3_9STAP|nr:DUF771 domain-containing protein [Macrococcus bovicus]TDM15722.1 DUF771 domain-containing protein [Macrococcus bovicus]
MQITIELESFQDFINEQVQEALKEAAPVTKYWGVKDVVESHLPLKSKNAVKDLLKFYQKEINEFVHISAGSGDEYVLKAKEFCEWFDSNYKRIMDDKKLWRVS